MVSQLQLRPLEEHHVAGAVALQRVCFPDPFPAELLWNAEHLQRHLQIFPAGQFVAILDDLVVGSASNCRVSHERWEQHVDWEATVGGFMFDGHVDSGPVLFGADISVHPDYRGRGIARKLYEARFGLVRSLDLQMYGTACRMPDFATSGHPSVESYADAVTRGVLTDRTLTPLLKIGLTFAGVVHGHMDDEESGHAAAILEWRP